VLVVDNEPVALAALSHLMQGWGWQVHAAAHRQQALAVPWTPHLQVLDYHLDAGRTGLDLWRELQQRHAEVPTVILTADRDGDLRQRLLDAGAIVLHKPLKPLALRQVLQRILAMRAKPESR
jgi:CheY-like chemotaxis protein